jgi:hypothetical protein
MDPLLQALVTAGIIDADLANQVNRQSDPDAARAWAEELLFVAAQSDLSAQQQRLLSLLASTAYQPTETQLGAFWREEEGRFGRALLPALREVASEQAAVRSTAVARATGRDADQTFALINRQVLAWVDDYYINADGDPARLGSLPNLTLTARTRFAQAFQEWQRGELEVGRPVGLPQLIDALTPAFGAVRAEAIAVTETTRLFTETLIIAEHENEHTVAYRWNTAADELVCPRCSPRSNRVYTKKEVESGAVERPPIHTRDRCGLTPETEETLRLSKERAGSFGENAVSRQVRQATAAEDDSGPVTVEPATPARQPAGQAPQLRSVLPPDPAAETLLQAMEKTLASVHKLPASLPPVPLRIGIVDDDSAGAYAISADGRNPDMIMIRDGKGAQFYAWHEFGHYLDHQILQVSEEFRGKGATPPAVDDALRAELWQTLNNTTQITKMRQRYEQLNRDNQGAPGADEKLLGYYISEREVWARAYSQYVAVKSGEMRGDYEKSLSQWRDADFAPVERVIDKIMNATGLRSP